MRKLFLTLLLVVSILGLIGAGCNRGDDAEDTPSESETVTVDEAKTKAVAYIMNMDLYKNNNAYHIEEIETLPGQCSQCWVFRYEFRMRNVAGDVTGVSDVDVTFENGEITDVNYTTDQNEEPATQAGNPDEQGSSAPAAQATSSSRSGSYASYITSAVYSPELDRLSVRSAFYRYHDLNYDLPISVDVSKQEDGYMRGLMSFGDSYGKATFLAAKDQSQWKVAFNGAGDPSCSDAAKYNFPADMVKDCYPRFYPLPYTYPSVNPETYPDVSSVYYQYYAQPAVIAHPEWVRLKGQNY